MGFNLSMQISNSVYESGIAIKSRSPDERHTQIDALVESTHWQDINRRLFEIKNSDYTPEQIQVNYLEYIQELEVKPDQVVRDAKDAVPTADEYGHQRFVARYHQIIDLLEQGKEALEAAIEDEVIILEGQRYAGLHSFCSSILQLSQHRMCRFNRHVFRHFYGR